MTQINSITTNSPATEQLNTLKDRVQSNWENRKATVISSGTVSLAFAAAAGTLAFLGGPITLIAGLAAAAIAGVGLLIASLTSKPTTQALEKKELNGANTNAASSSQEQPIAEAKVEPKKQGLIGRAIAFVKAHPFISAASIAGITGLGLYSLGIIGKAALPIGKAALPVCPIKGFADIAKKTFASEKALKFPQSMPNPFASAGATAAAAANSVKCAATDVQMPMSSTAPRPAGLDAFLNSGVFAAKHANITNNTK